MDDSATFSGPSRPEGISDVRLCPFCAEEIKAAAVLCRFCGSTVEPSARNDAPRSHAVTPHPRHPEVVVTVPIDADSGLVRSRVQKALGAAGHDAEAQAYLDETDELRSSPTELVRASRSWVTIEEDVTRPGVAPARPAPPVPNAAADQQRPAGTPAPLLEKKVQPKLAALIGVAAAAIVVLIGVIGTATDEPGQGDGPYEQDCVDWYMSNKGYAVDFATDLCRGRYYEYGGNGGWRTAIGG